MLMDRMTNRDGGSLDSSSVISLATILPRFT